MTPRVIPAWPRTWLPPTALSAELVTLLAEQARAQRRPYRVEIPAPSRAEIDREHRRRRLALL